MFHTPVITERLYVLLLMLLRATAKAQFSLPLVSCRRRRPMKNVTSLAYAMNIQ